MSRGPPNIDGMVSLKVDNLSYRQVIIFKILVSKRFYLGHQRKRSEESLNAMAMLEMHISHVIDILEVNFTIDYFMLTSNSYFRFSWIWLR